MGGGEDCRAKSLMKLNPFPLHEYFPSIAPGGCWATDHDWCDSQSPSEEEEEKKEEEKWTQPK